MDLVYIPEVLTYGSFRNPQYQDYEQPWNKDCFGYGRSTSARCQRYQQKAQPLQESYYQQRKQVSKDNCHLCRESKRRSLALYIRAKSRRDSCQEIHEQIEEEKEEDEENETITDEKKDNVGEIHDRNVSIATNEQEQREASKKLANKCVMRT